MNMGSASRSYSIATTIYEGPLELLLQLIEHAELDITKISLAQVTDQYLDHLNKIREENIHVEEVSSFLVIAAKLLQIKSEVLLPRPPQREPGEEDPGEALARQLRIYKRFKEIARWLSASEIAHVHTYSRLATPPKVEMGLNISNMTLEALLQAATVFSRGDYRFTLDAVVSAQKITIREKIEIINQLLRENKRTSFRRLLTGKIVRLDIVVTFLALLELMKRGMIQARQEALFTDIELEPAEAWSDAIDFELEFGE